ncbi:MAG: Mth938-like domain-containing protein [Macromonas bipunctata]|nr:Mth938-like domain-containing protein [Macromonas bipunctata]
MKLQPDRSDSLTINAHGPGWIAVNGQKYHQSVLISARAELTLWDCSRFDAIEARHFDQLGESQPELVLFGSGQRLRFPHPSLLQGLIGRRIGVETMDSLAACRTYNILAAEGRKVALALLLENA